MILFTTNSVFLVLLGCLQPCKCFYLRNTNWAIIRAVEHSRSRICKHLHRNALLLKTEETEAQAIAGNITIVKKWKPRVTIYEAPNVSHNDQAQNSSCVAEMENANRAEHKDVFFSRHTFESIGMSSLMVQALKGMKIFTPSHIQALTWRRIRDGDTILAAEQSGSGKTIGYTSAVLDSLISARLHMDAHALNSNETSLITRPVQVLILCPTGGLAEQITRAMKTLINNAKASNTSIPNEYFPTALCVTGGYSLRDQLRLLRRVQPSVIIATPGRLLKLLYSDGGTCDFSRLKTVILDEVDVLYSDKSFNLRLVGNACMNAPQFVFVTATLPENIALMLEADFENLLSKKKVNIAYLGQVCTE